MSDIAAQGILRHIFVFCDYTCTEEFPRQAPRSPNFPGFATGKRKGGRTRQHKKGAPHAGRRIPPPEQVTLSLVQLVSHAVTCTEPDRVPFGGRVSTCLFDKTGTLTSESMDIEGVRAGAASDLPPNLDERSGLGRRPDYGSTARRYVARFDVYLPTIPAHNFGGWISYFPDFPRNIGKS